VWEQDDAEMPLICGAWEAEYFYEGDWTGQITLKYL
jgi:hypothetical protein